MAESDPTLGVLGGKPVSWQGFENWEERAQRIATMLRQRQEQIRYVGWRATMRWGTCMEPR